jgi:energy-coupling factor transporter ATP-binding protein EcfA2
MPLATASRSVPHAHERLEPSSRITPADSSSGAFEDVDLTVRSGEVVALYGKLGSGTAEVAEIAFGLRALSEGTCRLRGADHVPGSPNAAIHAGVGLWPGTEGRLLMPEPMITVASPALAASRKRWSPADLAKVPLLQASTRPYAWRHWFEALGLSVDNDMAGPRLELFSMLSEAAAQGLGVALVPRMLVENELASGRLVQLLAQESLSDRRYYLIYPGHKAASPALRAFAEWLESEAARYRAEVGLG